MLDEVDCWCRSHVICPYCGHRGFNSREFQEGETEVECPDCGREFTVEAEVFVNYTTMPKEGWPE